MSNSATNGLDAGCMVCRHDDRAAFDKALAKGTRTAADIAREIGCHRSTVTRHKNECLLPELSEAAREERFNEYVDVLNEGRRLYHGAREALRRAEESDSWRAVRAFQAEARKNLELLAEMQGELQREGTVNVEIGTLQQVVLDALDERPDARADVARALYEAEDEE